MSVPEIRLEARLKNNILYHAIYDNWPSVAAFCREKKLSQITVGCLINLSRSPLKKRNKEYTASCEKLAKILCYLVEDLFPLHIYGLERKKVVKEFSITEIGWREVSQIPVSTDPLTELEKTEKKKIIRKFLGSLKPREERVLRLRFGIDDYKERTLGEISAEIGICTELVRQIEARALRKMRHPQISGTLKEYK